MCVKCVIEAGKHGKAIGYTELSTAAPLTISPLQYLDPSTPVPSLDDLPTGGQWIAWAMDPYDGPEDNPNRDLYVTVDSEGEAHKTVTGSAVADVYRALVSQLLDQKDVTLNLDLPVWMRVVRWPGRTPSAVFFNRDPDNPEWGYQQHLERHVKRLLAEGIEL